LEPGLELELGFQFFSKNQNWTRTGIPVFKESESDPGLEPGANQQLTAGFGPSYLDLGLIFRTGTGVVFFFPFFEETNPELEPEVLHKSQELPDTGFKDDDWTVGMFLAGGGRLHLHMIAQWMIIRRHTVAESQGCTVLTHLW
jgi:hypothetical protein